MKRFVGVCFLMGLIVAANAYGKTNKESAPGQSIPSAAQDAAQLSGKVVETQSSGGYTYVLLEKHGKKIWVAVPQMQVKVGQEVAFKPGAEMKNFQSKGLNRTFETIIFSEGPMSAAKPVAVSGETAPEKHAGSAGAAPKTSEKINVPKATGPDAYTISEVLQKRTQLNKKQAVIKAKVMKVSLNIMGKNWIHLQDGTGSADKGTNDVVATTTEKPAVGEIITIKGTIASDKDFGYGYKYNVIIEDAKLVR